MTLDFHIWRQCAATSATVHCLIQKIISLSLEKHESQTRRLWCETEHVERLMTTVGRLNDGTRPQFCQRII